MAKITVEVQLTPQVLAATRKAAADRHISPNRLISGVLNNWLASQGVNDRPYQELPPIVRNTKAPTP